MQIQITGIEGIKIIQPKVFSDKRGYFFESYNKELFDRVTGQEVAFVQDNELQSGYGVLRGLHYQIGTFAQCKLVRVIKGKVWDVAVDIRKKSRTFGQYYGCELSEENKLQFFIPPGFAHGFVVLSEYAIFSYKVDKYYSPENERGIIYNDPAINIQWPIAPNDIILSAKDEKLPALGQAITF